jgi:hypothetical protein
MTNDPVSGRYTGPKLAELSLSSRRCSRRGRTASAIASTEKFLAAQLAEIEGQLALRGDFVPALCPTLGVVSIPSAFGCEVIWWERDFPAVRPALADPEQVWDLRPPAITDGELGRVLDYTRYFRERNKWSLPNPGDRYSGPLDSARSSGPQYLYVCLAHASTRDPPFAANGHRPDHRLRSRAT